MDKIRHFFVRGICPRHNNGGVLSLYVFISNINIQFQVDYPDIASQIDQFIQKLEELKKVEKPFKFVSIRTTPKRTVFVNYYFFFVCFCFFLRHIYHMQNMPYNTYCLCNQTFQTDMSEQAK